MTELLSPAGSWEAMVAAVQSGADAVYMGFGSFNARRSAQNFSDESFAEAVRYCHLRGVKVYLTLNTLLTDRELTDAADALRKASQMGADAVLVQDWGALTLAQEVAPDLPIHASTQMSIHTLGGANYAVDLGMERVVLSRELSRDDIAEICRGCRGEIETFLHGALCMCYSGQCEMSALIGGRSGNRGRCAQPCRLPYGVNSPCKGEHPLSLKDANLAPYVQEMSEMGVACLKLEGRMKRPEYVSVITAIYRRLLDEKRGPTKAEQHQLLEAFSRNGFTDGYYLDKKGAHMFGIRPENARWPEEWFATVKAEYETEHFALPVTFTCTVRAGESATLTATCRDHTVTVYGATPEAARNRTLTEEELRTRLSKTGGTLFTVQDMSITLDDGLMLSASSVNALRREALETMESALLAMPERRTLDAMPLPDCRSEASAPLLTCSITKPEQLTAELIACHPDTVYIPLELLDTMDLSPYAGQTTFCAVLPRIFRTADEAVLREKLQKAKHISAVAVSNLGHLPIVKDLGLEIRGDFGLNVFNSRALLFLQQQGLSTATVSFELRHEQVRDLRKYLPCEAIVYGALPLMVMENCVIANNVGCRCDKENYLTDRTGARFPLLPVYGHRNEIENSKTLFLADKPEYRRVGLQYARLRFTTESPEDCVAVLRRYMGEGDWLPQNYTRGLFYRGVE